MPTKLQRKVLWQMLNNGGKAIFFTGHKSTSWGNHYDGVAVIRCSECVKWGLHSQKWIEKLTQQYSRKIEDHTYVITTEGIRVAGKHEPEMKALSHGAHGIRWG
jgi:hypothetical protein